MIQYYAFIITIIVAIVGTVIMVALVVTSFREDEADNEDQLLNKLVRRFMIENKCSKEVALTIMYGRKRRAQERGEKNWRNFYKQ